MKKLVLTSLALGSFVGSAFGAKVSFSLDIESLSSEANAPISNSGLLVLIVDADDNGFQSPVADTIVTGDDQIVATWDLSDFDHTTTDITLVKGGVEYQTEWDLGDPLGLVWFPGLSSTNDTPAADEPYGFFTDSQNLVSGHSWRMPAEGALLHSLKLFTQSATKLVQGGDVPDSIGKASYMVGTVPTAPTPVTEIVATPKKSTIELAWSGGTPGAGGYIVQRKLDGEADSAYETVGVVDGGVSDPFVDGNVSPGAKYDYRLISMSGLGVAQFDYDDQPDAPFIQALRSRIVNLAARGFMGDDVVNRRGIGFIVKGTESMNVLIQAVGPSMPGSLAKPVDTLLTFFYGIAPTGVDRQIDENDDWDLDTAEADAILAAQDKYGAQVLNVGAGDSALIANVEQIRGGYTNRVQNPVGGGGVSSVQVYDLNWREDNPADARLTGLASRGYVGLGAETLRGSFNIQGEVPMKVLIRANGPMLASISENDPFTLDNVVVDPFMTVLKYNRTERVWEEYATNDNWGTRTDGVTTAEIDAMSESVGLRTFPAGSADCVVVDTFEPGIYTAIVNGVGDTVGVGTIEIYEIEE